MKANAVLCINSTGKPIYSRKKEPKQHLVSSVKSKNLDNSNLKTPELSSTPMVDSHQNIQMNSKV